MKHIKLFKEFLNESIKNNQIEMDKLQSFESFNQVYETKLTLFKDMKVGDEYKMFGDDKENKPMILKKTGDSEAQIVEVGSVKGVKKR